MKQYFFYKSVLVCYFLFVLSSLPAVAQSPRREVPLNENWMTFASAPNATLTKTPAENLLNKRWIRVNVPHNWDAYEGYRRLLHGNRHGDAWYRKSFSIRENKIRKRFFLYFEGVGTYATVFVNNKRVGEHAGGRTTFTIDITDVIKTDGSDNQLAVHASHPAGIKDLPWVCGGCSEERGFSEGSQPMGIFRPVRLVVTNDTRIEPFGVHAWSEIGEVQAKLHLTSTIKNFSNDRRQIVLVHQLQDATGKIVKEVKQAQTVLPQDSLTIALKNILINKPELWSPGHPYLYTIVTTIREQSLVIDRVETTFGFRTINWKNATNQFFINGKPVFINGVAEYEHLPGQSHAFTEDQVLSRMKWLQAAGFNAFRDGHQPHNLLYGEQCDEKGILWWTQLSAHVYYNTPAFRNNFKQLLKEWVIERRNNPSVVLWGLQNESQVPEDFARECTELIRQLDPTASSQRLVTTCNGGAGTDWDVPQNWTGTYGGDPSTYADDLKKQVLVGEYGAWRTIDLHTEGPFIQNGTLSEDRMTQLMEQKVKLAASVADSVAGHFFWLLTSHDNPGRVQGGEGMRELDRIGPVNYKGLLTPWEEPLDVYYMFRSHYASKFTSPMLYIVSHTWPGRWTTTGPKDGIVIYSNCDEVELFNDVNAASLGRKKRTGSMDHFRWDSVDIRYNLLYAVGYVNGKAVAADTVLLHHLPVAPNFESLFNDAQPITRSVNGYSYIYRMNCGGPEYTDAEGNKWQADRHLGNTMASLEGTGKIVSSWGSKSWTDEFPSMPAYFGSQRRTFAPIKGTRDWNLFSDFRYGKGKLSYEFSVPDGEYLVELYFIEPWLGIGGGIDATGMRLFDIAVNDKIVLKNIDLWKEAGPNKAIKKTVIVKITGGKMVISFPAGGAGQAVISAIAIASRNPSLKKLNNSSASSPVSKNVTLSSWLDEGNYLYTDSTDRFRSLPSNLYGANWIQRNRREPESPLSLTFYEETDVYIGQKKSLAVSKRTIEGYEDTQTDIETDERTDNIYKIYRKRVAANTTVATEAPIIVWQPATNMQPAYDLKKVTPYRADVMGLSTGVAKEQFAGREAAVVKMADRVSVEWPVQTGVADIYSLTVKYYFPGDSLRAKLQLIGAGNTMMLEEDVTFTFTRTGKWNSFTINTGSMINAGNYLVKLLIDNGVGLVISGVDVQ